jgi:hypothetical protein
MIGLHIQVDTSDMERGLDAMARKQLPFAVAAALTATAKDAQAAVKAQMPARFTLRGPWVPKGIRIRPAKKAQWPAPSVEVGSIDRFMELQQTGGKRVGRRGRAAVPDAARPTPSALTKPSQWPAKLLKRIDAFLMRGRGGNTLVVTKREGYSREKRFSDAYTVWYVLRGEVTVSPRLDLERTVRAVVARSWANRATEAIRKAMETRKK